jgi:hypothetical protein
LVDTSDIRRKERKSQWATRYNDRLPQSTLEGRPYEEGQEHGSSVDISSEGGHGANRQQRGENGELWRPEDESYYGNKDEGSSGGRWRYPANFDDAVMPSSSSKRIKKKKEKKDRWARTEDAHSVAEQQSTHRKKSKKKKSKTSIADESTYSRDEGNGYPEDAEGGLYGDAPRRKSAEHQQPKSTTDLNHEF